MRLTDKYHNGVPTDRYPVTVIRDPMVAYMCAIAELTHATMMADLHTNFAVSTVSGTTVQGNGSNPGSAGTAIAIGSGDGATFPAAPFNVMICPANTLPTKANAEIVRVLAVSGDVFTPCIRQTGSEPNNPFNRTIAVGDIVSLADTAHMFVDAEQQLPASLQNFVESGCVWTADSAGSTLKASMQGGLTTTVNAHSGDQIGALTSNTLTVVSTTGFPTFGHLCVNTSGGTAIIYYTGTTGTTFTGCVLVTGTSSWTISTTANLNQVCNLSRVWIGGVRLAVAAVFGRSFTASDDTYVDLQNNGDGTASITYSAQSNNNAGGAMVLGNSGTTANTIRIAIVCAGSSNIANAAHINQGDPACVVPIVSSVAYSVTDSLGNLIYPTTPMPGIIGWRQLVGSFTDSTINGTSVDVTGLSMTFVVPPGPSRKVKLRCAGPNLSISLTNPLSGGNVNTSAVYIKTSGGTVVTQANYYNTLLASSGGLPVDFDCTFLLTPGTYTYKVSLTQATTSSSNLILLAASVAPVFISAELV